MSPVVLDNAPGAAELSQYVSLVLLIRMSPVVLNRCLPWNEAPLAVCSVLSLYLWFYLSLPKRSFLAFGTLVRFISPLQLLFGRCQALQHSLASLHSL